MTRTTTATGSAQRRVLAILTPDWCSVTEVMKRVSMRRQQATNVLRSLADRGMIERTRGPSGRGGPSHGVLYRRPVNCALCGAKPEAWRMSRFAQSDGTTADLPVCLACEG